MGGKDWERGTFTIQCLLLHQVEKVFSFVPPDGRFQLVTYQLGSQK